MSGSTCSVIADVIVGRQSRTRWRVALVEKVGNHISYSLFLFCKQEEHMCSVFRWSVAVVLETVK